MTAGWTIRQHNLAPPQAVPRAAQPETDADLSPFQILFWMLPVIIALAVLAENLP